MVMLLLNLAVIPDEVVKKIDFNPGWSRRFMKSMNEYKEKWDEEVDDKTKPEHTVKWRFQDAELEDDYQKFVIKQYETDTELHKDTIAF